VTIYTRLIDLIRSEDYNSNVTIDSFKHIFRNVPVVALDLSNWVVPMSVSRWIGLWLLTKLVRPYTWLLRILVTTHLLLL
jgi:hypothetical protein